MSDHDQKTKTEGRPDISVAVAGSDAAADYAARNAAHYAAEAAEAAEAETGEGAPTPEQVIATLEAEKTELAERYVRLAAEMENLRKRTERETADARKYAVSRFAADMLGVSDNLHRAKESAGQGPDALEAIIEGVDVTAREMAHILEKHGVVKIPGVGEKFDPNRHQAMYEVPDESVPSGTVVEQVQEGYMIGDRVLRAALVGVSKGGPKGPAALPDEPTHPIDVARGGEGEGAEGSGALQDSGDAGDDGPPQAA